MASKIKVYSPKIHRKGTTEEGVDIEYEEISDPFMLRSPKGPNSLVQDMEKPMETTTFRMKRGNTIVSKQPEFEEEFDEKEIESLFTELGNHKKSNLLK